MECKEIKKERENKRKIERKKEKEKQFLMTYNSCEICWITEVFAIQEEGKTPCPDVEWQESARKIKTRNVVSLKCSMCPPEKSTVPRVGGSVQNTLVSTGAYSANSNKFLIINKRCVKARTK